MDHAVPRLSLQLYPQPERRAPDCLPDLVAYLAYLAYPRPTLANLYFCLSSQVKSIYVTTCHSRHT